MDYYRSSRYSQIIAVLAIIVSCRCDPITRDIILTPKQSSQIKGKTLYYRPEEDLDHKPGVRVPWEKTLKYLTYLTLHGAPYEGNELSDDDNDYKQLMNASYTIQTDHIVINFGDTVTLAEGRVEKSSNNKYHFIEGDCSRNNQKCNEKRIIAKWTVQKIHHRDADKKFRYEIRFSIEPYGEDQDGIDRRNRDQAESRIMTNVKRVTRQFVLRDFDYPNSFFWFDEHLSQQRVDETRRYLERLHRFNEVFSQPIYIDRTFYTSDNPIIPPLNLGEFLQEPIQRSQSNLERYIAPTTYRPNYHVKFSKPIYSYQFPIEQESFPTKQSYVHQNYFAPDDKPRAYNVQSNLNLNPTLPPTFQFQTPTPAPIKHQIPIPPNFNGQRTQTPFPIQLTSPIIQAPPLLFSPYSTQQNLIPDQTLAHNLPSNAVQSFAQQLGVSNSKLTQRVAPSFKPFTYDLQAPVYQQQTYNQEATTQRPFIESPRVETVRYSEPDPLYQNANVYDDHRGEPIQFQNADEPKYYQNDFQRQEDTTFEQEKIHLEEYQTVTDQQQTRPELTETFSSEQQENHPGLITNEQTKPDDYEHSQEYDQSTTASVDNVQSSNNIQLQPPEPESTQQINTPSEIETTSTTTTPPANTPQSTPDSSIQASKHQQTIENVEITHLSQPVFAPQIDQIEITTSPSPMSTTTGRSLKQFEAILPPVTPKPNVLDNDGFGHIIKAQAHYKTPFERPVLRWKPKRPRTKNSDDFDPTIIIAKTKISRPLQVITSGSKLNDSNSVTIERVPDEDTYQKIYKLKSVTEGVKKNETKRESSDEAVPTKQSVSTSISIKVGTSDEVLVAPTVSLPNVELFEAKLEQLNINSSAINFFKASDKNEKANHEQEDDKIITRSILGHATRLG